MDSTRRARSAGFSFVELMFATGMVVTAVALLLGYFGLQYQETLARREKHQALQIANQVLAHLQQELRRGAAAETLIDAPEGNPELCAGVVGHGPQNRKLLDDWLWRRRVAITPMPGQPGEYEARVEVRRRSPAGPYETMAELAAVLREPLRMTPTIRSYDIYLLALENLPGLRLPIRDLRAVVGARLEAFCADNPGIELRPHWITRMSEGRRPDYLPAFGEFAKDYVYAYPDLDPGEVRARRQVDGIPEGLFDANLNPSPYSLADRYNPALRLPDELRSQARRQARVLARQQALAEARSGHRALPPALADMSAAPSWRLLLEDLNRNPARYKDALLLNLHGDLLPLPPLCNTALPAQNPTRLPGLRCVAHFEELRTRRAEPGGEHDAAVLRVYAFGQPGAELPESGICPEQHPIALRIEGVDLVDPERPGRLRPEVSLESLSGGVGIVDPKTGAAKYGYQPFAAARHVDDARGVGEMYYAAWFVDPGFGEPKHTLILLFNTPVVAPPVRNPGTRWRAPDGATAPAEDLTWPPRLPWAAARQPRAALAEVEDPRAGALQGLVASATARPLGLAYNPAPTAGWRGFAADLATPGRGAKNSARWRLRIPGKSLDADWFVSPHGAREPVTGDLCLRVETGFWTGPERVAGPAVPRGADGARDAVTYTWWARSADAVPYTERAQVQGDPRHNPYKDLCPGDKDFGGRLNTWFGLDERALETLPGLRAEELQPGWSDGRRVDVPELLSLFRRGLQRSGIRYATLGAGHQLRVALGGEPGLTHRQQVPPAGTYLGRGGDAGAWYGLAHLGDLCPDEVYVRNWQRPRRGLRAWGNLRRGSGRDALRQGHLDELLAGAGHRSSVVQRTNPRAWRWGSLFMPDPVSRQVTVAEGRGVSLLTKAGLGLERRFHRPEPSQARVRSFLVPGQMECDAAHARPRFVAEHSGLELVESWAKVSGIVLDGAPSWALLRWAGAEHEVAYYCLAGMQGTIDEDLDRGVSGLLASLQLAPGPSLPRLEIPAPAPDPGGAGLRLQWHVDDAAPEADLSYRVLISYDEGLTYTYAVDGADAVPGQRPEAERRHRDAGPGPESITWSPPRGRDAPRHVWLRVEAWRSSGPHFCYRERRIHVPR